MAVLLYWDDGSILSDGELWPVCERTLLIFSDWPRWLQRAILGMRTWLACPMTSVLPAISSAPQQVYFLPPMSLSRRQWLFYSRSLDLNTSLASSHLPGVVWPLGWVWKALYASRLLLGFFEAGLIPCIDVYIGLVYKKRERGQHSAIIFAFSAISSAFGGILAFGLTQIKGPGDFQGWHWLFVVEAILTIVIVPLFFFMFPQEPREAWFLTPEEKEMISARYANDPHWGIDEEFKWSSVLSIFVDPKFHAL